MVERFLSQTSFTSQEDFIKNLKINVPENFNFGYDVVDAWAAELILNNDTHPSVEIDKVCTPGGITIKGINELEHEGFTSTVIKAIKASK